MDNPDKRKPTKGDQIYYRFFKKPKLNNPNVATEIKEIKQILLNNPNQKTGGEKPSVTRNPSNMHQNIDKDKVTCPGTSESQLFHQITDVLPKTDEFINVEADGINVDGHNNKLDNKTIVIDDKAVKFDCPHQTKSVGSTSTTKDFYGVGQISASEDTSLPGVEFNIIHREINDQTESVISTSIDFFADVDDDVFLRVVDQ